MARVVVVDRNLARQLTVIECLKDVPGLVVDPAREEIATVHMLSKTRPEVIMLGTDDGDSWMLALLSSAAPRTPILAYTDHWDAILEKRATASGARELLSTRASLSHYLTAIMVALRDA